MSILFLVLTFSLLNGICKCGLFVPTRGYATPIAKLFFNPTDDITMFTKELKLVSKSTILLLIADHGHIVKTENLALNMLQQDKKAKLKRDVRICLSSTEIARTYAQRNRDEIYDVNLLNSFECWTLEDQYYRPIGDGGEEMNFRLSEKCYLKKRWMNYIWNLNGAFGKLKIAENSFSLLLDEENGICKVQLCWKRKERSSGKIDSIYSSREYQEEDFVLLKYNLKVEDGNILYCDDPVYSINTLSRITGAKALVSLPEFDQWLIKPIFNGETPFHISASLNQGEGYLKRTTSLYPPNPLSKIGCHYSLYYHPLPKDRSLFESLFGNDHKILRKICLEHVGLYSSCLKESGNSKIFCDVESLERFYKMKLINKK